MNGGQFLTNIANDLIAGGGTIVGLIAVLYGSFVEGQAVWQAYDIVQGRHDAPTWRAAATRAVIGAVLMGFAGFTAAVSQGVGGGQSGTTYAALSFASSAGNAGTTLSAVVTAVFQILQVMGLFSELRGVFAWLDIVDHKSNASLLRAGGYVVGGGCLVHLSLIVTTIDAVMGTGLFS